MTRDQWHTITLALSTLIGGAVILELAIHPEGALRLLDRVPAWAILAAVGWMFAVVLAVALCRSAHEGDQAMRLVELRQRADRERRLR